MNKVVFPVMIFILFVGSSGTVANAQEIPSWVKFNAGYWADGSIDDSTFINALQFLIKEQIVVIPQTETFEKQSEQIPSWVKFNAGYWAQDAITDLDFVNSMQYLIANGIVVIDHKENVPLSLSGSFVDADFIHKTSGSATVEFSDEKAYLHLGEDFKTTNGPDLYVYLATDKSANDFVNLGMIQSFSGAQSYEIPEDLDVEEYDEILIWCKAFGVLFGSAHTTIDDITVITITGTISYWQSIDGPSYAITPKEDLSVSMDGGKIYLYGDILDKSLDGKQVKITGKIVENYRDYQISKHGVALGGDPTTSVIFVSEVDIIPSN